MNYIPFYSREEDADDPHKLTDCEAFHMDEEEADKHEVFEPGGWSHGSLPGWYWQSCSPGCLPDDPTSIYGPFEKMDDAIADARERA